MKKYMIKTLGCKVNQFESESMARELAENGFNSSEKNEKVDLCIINTCSVTQKAAMQSRQTIRQAIRTHPEAKIIVTGCYSQTEAEHIQSTEGVDQLISNPTKHEFLALIRSHGNTDLPRPFIKGDSIQFKPYNCLPLGNRTRPFLKIQDGCNSYCSYCIVPHARGASRSLPLENVLEDIQTIGEKGYKEVVLTGIHLGCWGNDLIPPVDVFSLLKRIYRHKLIDRVRLSSMEPGELSEDILRFISASQGKKGSTCDHFHIPLQSGDDIILKQMGRPYDRNLCKNLVQMIHHYIPHAAIGLDILIGFPGESDQAFENTYNLINDLPITYLHVFPFSPRKGTPAYTLPDRLPQDIMKTRCKIMRQLGNNKKKLFYQSFIGKSLVILVEDKRDRKTALLKGMTSNYIPILVRGEDSLKNSLVHIVVDRVDESSRVYGTIK